MTINISKNTTVAEFQSAFSTAFPYLKSTFFRHNDPEIWSGYMVLNNQIQLAELSDGVPQFAERLTISPNMTVAEFENLLQNRYGLTVRIFRFHNGDWLETTNSCHLDLEGQNERGATNILSTTI